MQLTVYCDSEGNIASLAVAQPDAVPTQLVTEAHPGLRRTEIQPPADASLNLDSPRLYDDMEKLIENYQVSVQEGGTGTLTSKADAATGQSSY
jgi:hypothetical protein